MLKMSSVVGCEWPLEYHLPNYPWWKHSLRLLCLPKFSQVRRLFAHILGTFEWAFSVSHVHLTHLHSDTAIGKENAPPRMVPHSRCHLFAPFCKCHVILLTGRSTSVSTQVRLVLTGATRMQTVHKENPNWRNAIRMRPLGCESTLFPAVNLKHHRFIILDTLSYVN